MDIEGLQSSGNNIPRTPEERAEHIRRFVSHIYGVDVVVRGELSDVDKFSTDQGAEIGPEVAPAA